MANRTLIAIDEELNNKINKIIFLKKQTGFRIIKKNFTDELITIGLKSKRLWE